MKTKYVVFHADGYDMMVIFPEILVHAQVAAKLSVLVLQFGEPATPVSARIHSRRKVLRRIGKHESEVSRGRSGRIGWRADDSGPHKGSLTAGETAERT